MSAVLALEKHCLHKCHLYSEDIEHLYSLEIYDLFLDVHTSYSEAFYGQLQYGFAVWTVLGCFQVAVEQVVVWMGVEGVVIMPRYHC